jgi:two-component system response regulator YesN
MPYQVFFVEDEIVTREGIRNNVDWHGHGFDLCGEAPDGEIALPLLQAAPPDVLITDIKMPFMDGLQLCRIVRERMPTTKIVILSGHDEFEYAQTAIKLGVTEYLLKPVTVQNLHQVLRRLAAQLDHEQHEQEALRRLRDQVAESRAALSERLWFKLLVGAISLPEAIQQSELLGLDLIARCYLVVVIRFVDYDDCQRAHDLVFDIVGRDPDVSLLRKDLEELVLIIKGNTSEYLLEARDVRLDQIRRRANEAKCQLVVGLGAPRERITEIGQSFLEALSNLDDRHLAHNKVNADLLKVDKSALEDYLKCGVQAELDEFFDSFILPLGPACQSSIVRNYIYLDILFTTARLVSSWGAEPEELLPEINQLDSLLPSIRTVDDIRLQAQPILNRAMTFRDEQTHSLHIGVVQQAREYIDHHYTDSNISLQVVASLVGHSPSHFCTVFGEATGRTFKGYLTELRIKRAKELLRTTTLRAAEVSEQVGYNDPHYFSVVFRKSTGSTPREFRARSQPGRPDG